MVEPPWEEKGPKKQNVFANNVTAGPDNGHPSGETDIRRERYSRDQVQQYRSFESCPFQVLNKFTWKVVTGRPEPVR